MIENYEKMNKTEQDILYLVSCALHQTKPNVEGMDFEKISVTNITQMAKISRSTFYLHYEDKYDLLDKMDKIIQDKERLLQFKVNSKL